MKKKEIQGHIQQFQDIFRSLDRTRNTWSIWADFVVMLACSISNSVDANNRASREDMYLKVSAQYTAIELEQFTRLSEVTATAFEENPDQDFLGTLFNRLELNNKHRGQFFTPYGIAKLMAMMQCVSLAEEIAAKGYISVNDCCCGAGALLIAFANAARDQGINYQRDILFVAQDIDFIVALICYIQNANINKIQIFS